MKSLDKASVLQVPTGLICSISSGAYLRGNWPIDREIKDTWLSMPVNSVSSDELIIFDQLQVMNRVVVPAVNELANRSKKASWHRLACIEFVKAMLVMPPKC
jgi:hypothetical protein